MATAEYMRRYRANNIEYMETQRKRNAAHAKALRAVANDHKEEFDTYYHKFLKEAGLNVSRVTKLAANGSTSRST
jgi:hypothetical protein